jgi:hypothetical protein
VGFHICNLRSFVCEQYHIFFHLWGNGGANWVQEFRKNFTEEEHQWTLAHRKKATAQKYFRDVVKRSHFLSGANRVSMGMKNQQSKRMATMHHSVFDRTEGISRKHPKDHYKQMFSSVFDHLELPVDRLDHQKDHLALNSKDHHVYFQNCSRNQHSNQLPSSNLKGK